jgi:hypothetical protein
MPVPPLVDGNIAAALLLPAADDNSSSVVSSSAAVSSRSGLLPFLVLFLLLGFAVLFGLADAEAAVRPVPAGVEPLRPDLGKGAPPDATERTPDAPCPLVDSRVFAAVERGPWEGRRNDPPVAPLESGCDGGVAGTANALSLLSSSRSPRTARGPAPATLERRRPAAVDGPAGTPSSGLPPTLNPVSPAVDLDRPAAGFGVAAFERGPRPLRSVVVVIVLERTFPVTARAAAAALGSNGATFANGSALSRSPPVVPLLPATARKPLRVAAAMAAAAVLPSVATAAAVDDDEEGA